MTRVHCTSSGEKHKPPVRPFAALPHDLAGDPTIPPTSKAILLALLFWARGGDSCWPSDRSIGARVGRSAPTVQRHLRALERRGLVRRLPADNPTGRRIILGWRADPGGPSVKNDQGGQSKSPAALRPKMINEGTVPVERDPLTENGPKVSSNGNGPPALPLVHPEPPPLPRPTPAPAIALREPQGPERPRPRRGPTPADLAAWRTSGDPILAAEAARKLAPPVEPAARPRPATTAEFLARIRDDPGRPIEAAELLAQDLDDRKSWAGFHARCREAWSGVIEPADLAAAYEAARSPGVRNPGALFMTRLRGRSGPGSPRPGPR